MFDRSKFYKKTHVALIGNTGISYDTYLNKIMRSK